MDNGSPTAGCPVCGSDGWQEMFRIDRVRIVRCPTCGIGRTVPPPPESDGREAFGGDDAYYRRFYTEEAALRYRFAADILAALREFKRSGRILDVGCGMGFFVDYAARAGYRCEGIDTSSAATRFARDELNLDVVTADFMDAAFAPRAGFDAVTLNHVLEHVSKPVAFLRKARRALKPGGVVVSSVPNFGGLLPRMLKGAWYGLQPSQHVWQFTPASLAGVFERAGFVVERLAVGSMHYTPAPDWKATVIFCVAKVSAALGLGDNLMLVARTNGHAEEDLGRHPDV